MRLRSLTASAGAAGLVLAITLAGTAAAQDPVGLTAAGSGAATGVAAAPLDGKACKGADYTGPSNGFVTAQDFETSSDQFDAVGGQTFKLPRKCKVRSIYVEGAGNPDAGTLHVWIYRAKSGLPDKDREICQADITGVPGPIFKAPFRCTLKKGNYAIAVQNQVNREPNGQWFWNLRAGTGGASWKNPANGFGTGCVDWGTLETCLEITGSEFIFALQKGRAA